MYCLERVNAVKNNKIETWVSFTTIGLRSETIANSMIIIPFSCKPKELIIEKTVYPFISGVKNEMINTAIPNSNSNVLIR